MTERSRSILFLLAAAAGAALCFKFPDLDIPLLGIRNHRYFLFHSAILPALLWLAVRSRVSRRLGVLWAGTAAAFALGVGAHLVTDTFQTTRVVFPFVGNLVRGTSLDDRLWEGANAAACGALAWRTHGAWRARARGAHETREGRQ